MALQDATELKGLETKLKVLEKERETHKQLANETQHKLTKINSNIKTVNDEIWKLKNKKTDIIVTEHAMVRYIQNIMGIDMDELAKKILPDEVKARALAMGDGKYTHDEVTLVVKDGAIVTVYPKD